MKSSKIRKVATTSKSKEDFENDDYTCTVDYENGTAEIPEWCGNYGPANDYPDVEDDVMIWRPLSERDERAMPFFMCLARSALTYGQVHQGVPDNEAMENSCSGYGEQHISDVLHDSGYSAPAALRTLMTKETPRKVSDRWTVVEMNLFQQGLTQYRKNFTAIRSNLLPHKTTMDIIEFYYTWKRTKHVKGVAKSQARAFLSRRNKPKSLIVGSPMISGIVTRARLAAKENSGTPVRVAVSRKDVYTGVKRKRRASKQTRVPSIEA